jgi:hypothetical protein
VGGLFAAGEKAKLEAERLEKESKRHRVSIKYRAPQIIDEDGSKVMRAGAKLIGFLVNPIDTRSQSIVRVRLPKGGEEAGVEIEPGSTLVGQFSYQGEGESVLMTFSRLDMPNGRSKKINAVAMDARSFTVGVRGEEFTGAGEKLAAHIGLNMFAGMADTLTERESLGGAFGNVQAKPTMKNALLQGLTRATQDQANRIDSTISQAKNYVLIPEGKEMIIELQEDLGK